MYIYTYVYTYVYIYTYIYTYNLVSLHTDILMSIYTDVGILQLYIP